MATRKNPSTSLAAYEQAKPMMDEHHRKIIDALAHLGVSNYEKIAAYCKLDRHQVGRRLSELERKLIVFKPGSITKTKSGRRAFDYCLTEQHTLKVEHPATQLVNKTEEIQQWMNDYIDGQFDHPISKSFVEQGNLFQP